MGRAEEGRKNTKIWFTVAPGQYMLEIWWRKELYLATLFSADTSHPNNSLAVKKNIPSTSNFLFSFQVS